jgi:replicative DNA helicase
MESQGFQDRVPPQNLEAEQSTLGSMMIDREALEKGVDILRTEDFYRSAHSTVFDALVSLAERNEPVDLVTVQEELRKQGKLDGVGGTEYLMALIDTVPTAANVEYYAKIVEQKAMLRKLVDAGGQIVSWAHTATEEAESVVDQAERLIFQISQRKMGEYFTPLRKLAQAAYERLEIQYQQQLEVSGLRTGFDELDKITAGLQTSDFIIVAARPSMGKTAFCLDIARSVAVKTKVPVAIFSLEMSKEQLTLRLVSSESRVDAHRMRTGKLKDDDWLKLAEGTGRLYSAPIFIDDSTGTSPLQMRAKCRRLKAETGLSLIIVDYLQLMQSSKRTENRVQEIGDIARGLKNLAREMNVPVIALSQLSRAVEQRENKRPMLSDLRESGSIEAEADLVMFLYRESYYKQKAIVMDGADAVDINADPSDGDIAEVIIGKQRNGPTGTIKLSFLQQYASFANLEAYRDDEPY